MDALSSRQVEFLLCRAYGWECGRQFGALGQGLWRAAIPFLRKCVISAAKLTIADLMDFAVPEISDFVGGRKCFKTAVKSAARQTLRKQLSTGSKKKTASRVIPNKSAEQTSRF